MHLINFILALAIAVSSIVTADTITIIRTISGTVIVNPPTSTETTTSKVTSVTKPTTSTSTETTTSKVTSVTTPTTSTSTETTTSKVTSVTTPTTSTTKKITTTSTSKPNPTTIPTTVVVPVTETIYTTIFTTIYTTSSVVQPPSTKPSTTQTKPTTTAPPDPNLTKCPVPKYYQCGGAIWKGCTTCEKGTVCTSQNEFYYQCVETGAAVVAAAEATAVVERMVTVFM
ncbi:hypothetical protein B0J14DRAFT_602654 [Halenospora varia]|nr:hypothetical protein B0J14DRAFT_602654 [Halenospora varia]